MPADSAQTKSNIGQTERQKEQIISINITPSHYNLQVTGGKFYHIRLVLKGEASHVIRLTDARRQSYRCMLIGLTARATRYSNVHYRKNQDALQGIPTYITEKIKTRYKVFQRTLPHILPCVTKYVRACSLANTVCRLS